MSNHKSEQELHNSRQAITRNRIGKLLGASEGSSLLVAGPRPGRGGPRPGRGGPGRGQNQRARVNTQGSSFGNSFGSNTKNTGFFGSASPLLPQTSINRQNRSSGNSFGESAPLLVEEMEMPPPPPSRNGNRGYNPNSYIGNSSSELLPSRRASQFNSRHVSEPYIGAVKDKKENRNALLEMRGFVPPNSFNLGQGVETNFQNSPVSVVEPATLVKRNLKKNTTLSKLWQMGFDMGINNWRRKRINASERKAADAKEAELQKIRNSGQIAKRTVNNLLSELNILPASINVVKLRNDSKNPEHYISAYLKMPKLNKTKNVRLKEIILANYGNKPSTPRNSTTNTYSLSGSNNGASLVSEPNTFTLNKSIKNFLMNINVFEELLEESELKKIQNILKRNLNNENIENEDIRKLISAYKIFNSPASKGQILGNKKILKNRINRILA